MSLWDVIDRNKVQSLAALAPDPRSGIQPSSKHAFALLCRGILSSGGAKEGFNATMARWCANQSVSTNRSLCQLLHARIGLCDGDHQDPTTCRRWRELWSYFASEKIC